MPRFQQENVGREASLQWVGSQRETLMGEVMQALGNEVQKHQADVQARQQKQA
jgi:hypothetical protein